jgi:NRAMP (natural resistance-associated macrophage protein)-like metal ion transporter
VERQSEATPRSLKKRAPSGRALPRLLRTFGPGLITGASDDDPSGISTYSVAGATAGLSVLWLALLTTPMMAVVQGMCARIGMVTGAGLAAAMKAHLPAWVVYPLALAVVIANTFNVGADLEGMAASANMVLGIPVAAWVVAFALALVALQVFCSYKALTTVLKYLALTLLAYVVTAFVVRPDWGQVLLRAVVPQFRFDPAWLTTVVALLGTTITPYLFFWQSSLMVEEDKDQGKTTRAQRRGASAGEIRAAHLDVNAGMLVSNIVMFFIIVTTASTLGAHGKHNIASAQDAAQALRPLAGNFAYWLFALGMVGTGLLAIPALAGSSAYVAAETFKFRQGLNEPPLRARRFYAVLTFGVIAGMVMALARVDPIKMLFYSAVVNGVVAVPLVVVVVWIASSKRIMGKWVSSVTARVWGWFTAAAMGAAAVGMFAFWNKQ